MTVSADKQILIGQKWSHGLLSCWVYLVSNQEARRSDLKLTLTNDKNVDFTLLVADLILFSPVINFLAALIQEKKTT